jgi:uncharacterized membrane protein
VVFALVLVSAFLHAGWNALAKRARDPAWAVHVAVALSGAIAALIAGGELVLGRGGLTWVALAWSLFAGLFESRYFHVLGRALVSGPLAPVYTLSRGAAALLIWPVSVAFLDERLSTLGMLGTGLILAGLIAAGLARGMHRVAVRLGLECALAIAGYHFGYKLALDAGGSPAAVFTLSIGWATFLNLATGGSEFRASFTRAVRGIERTTLFAGVVCAASFLLFMTALARGGAGWVFTLRNTSVLFATGLGALAGEPPGRRQLLGAALVCSGAIALGLER